MSIPVNYGPMSEIQMQPDEVEYITGCIKSMGPEGKMIEWGSGGSTVKWLETMTDQQKLVTIEHSPDWHMKVSGYINTRSDINGRFTYLFKPELYGYQHGYANVNEEHPHGLDDYLIPNKSILDADIFLVDGIARATTAVLVKFLATKEDPVIFIHDFYGRERWYAWATQFFSKREKVGQTLVRLYK
ncbi:hypothetical protein UFOVP247_20 [uncultured Caudovirales phage]|uniref:Uncharacterized protein n=1 Tax=uncultured Caudovirales phage TaxID=2100421 RepID=A0A6J7WRU7_9CAUD|nr:hypothetical protein UFOVP247_20 [uncultured Caudovirales phage]